MALLPGQRLVNGFSNFLFGSNISIDFTANNARNTPAIQQQFKNANFQIMRCAIPPTDSNNNPTTNAYIDLTANACAAMGVAMLVILNHNNVPWNQQLVSYLGNRCNLYEFGNEPDLYPITGQQYLAFWNQCIPVMRGINPNAAYIGPVLGVFANLQSFCTPWLQGCITSGNLPDAFSYHVYPCTGDPSSTHCATRSTAFSSCYTQVDTLVRSILGRSLPQCMTEWNIDANGPPQPYTQDPNFAGPWVTQALNNMAQAGFAIACQWDAAGSAGGPGGPDDLISTQFPYPPQIEFAPIAAVIAQYMGGTGGGGGGGGGGGTSGTLNGQSGPQTVAVGPYTLQLNEWNSSATEQISYAYPPASFDVTNSAINNATNGAPGTFTSFYCGNHWGSISPTNPFPLQVSAITIGQVQMSMAGSLIGTGAWDFAYDNWFVPSSGDNQGSGHGSLEMMIWLNRLGGVQPAGSQVATNVSIGGHSYDVWWNGGSTLSYVFHTGVSSVTNLDYQPIIADAVSRGYLTSSWWLIDIEGGFELWQGGTGLTMNSFSVATTGGSTVNLTAFPSPISFSGTIGGGNPPSQTVTLTNSGTALASYTATTTQTWLTVAPTSGTVAGSGGTGTSTVTVSLTGLAVGTYTGVVTYTAGSNTASDNVTLIVSPQGGGGSGSGTLTLYMANAASATLPSANQLYAGASGSPATNATYTLIGNNVTGWGEIVAQGTSSAWAQAAFIGNPTGKGFLYDSTSLEMQQFLAGSWVPSIRLNASQVPNFAQAGILVGDITRRAFKRSSSNIYTPIVSSTLTQQTLTGAFTTYTLPAGVANAVTAFGVGDKLYLDQWFNCTQNANGSALQGIRFNRLSTDVTGLTGDPTTQIVSPGIQPTRGGGGGGGGGTIGAANPLGRGVFGMARLGDLSMTATRGHATPLGLSYVVSPSKYAKPLGVTYVIQKANTGICLLYYLITPPSNFAINGDGTIIAPDQVTYTPRPVVGRSLLANPLLQGYSTMTWTYSTLQLSEYNHLLSFYKSQSPKVLLTFPDNTGTWVQRNASMLPPSYGLLETVQVTNVSLVFTGLFL